MTRSFYRSRNANRTMHGLTVESHRDKPWPRWVYVAILISLLALVAVGLR